MSEQELQSGAGQHNNITSKLDASETALTKLAEVLRLLDLQGFSYSAIHVDQAIEALRREQVALRIPV
jgi:hypothetical protein